MWKSLPRFLFVTALVLISSHSSSIRADNPMAVKALIVTGDGAEQWKESSALLQKSLEAAGHEVEVTEEPGRDLTNEVLADFDVLVLNYRPTEAGAKANPQSVWTDAGKKAFADAVRSGTGLVVMRSASSAFNNDSTWAKEYTQMIAGGMRKGSRLGAARELAVTIQEDHPVTRNANAFAVGPGGLVLSPRITDGSRVLATAFDGREQDEPVVWVNQFGGGRVVHNLLEQNLDAMQGEEFAKLFEGGVAWAGEKGFRMIFDGKSLEGWEGNLRYWSVKDGAIVGTRPSWKFMPYHDFLCTVEEFKDFELRIEAKVIGQRNSGIVVRTKRQRYTYPIKGYEVDMGVFRWGWFYEEGGTRQVQKGQVQNEVKHKIQSSLRKGYLNYFLVSCI
ncbi:MAG: ThuA domain-containing protein, partial [Planctomycetota bacterium]